MNHNAIEFGFVPQYGILIVQTLLFSSVFRVT